MPKIDCFTKHFPTLSTEFSNRVKEGMSDHEQKLVGIELALEEHKKLNDKLNKFKKGIGIKKSEYTEPENFKKIKEINEEYNKNINQLKSKQDAIQESKTGEMGVRNETAIRQEVGSGNSESKEPTNKSNGQPNKESKENGASKEPNGEVEEPKSVGASHRSLNKLAEELGLPKVEKGDVLTKEEYNERGRKLIDAGVNPKDISDEFEKDGKVNAEMVSVARAHLFDLTKKANEARKEFGNDSKEYEKAKKEVKDWSEDVMKPMGTKWAEIGLTLQGENDLDTGSYVDVEKAVTDRTKKDLTESQSKKVEELTQKVNDLTKKQQELEKKLADVVNKAVVEAEKVEKEPKTLKERAKNVADIIRKGKLSRPDIFSSATPASLVWDTAVETAAKTIEGLGTIAQAINDGLEHIKNSDWYKGLEDDKKEKAEKAFKDYFKDALKKEDIYTKFVDKKDSKFTTQDVKDIWEYAKYTYLDKGASYSDMLNGVSKDLGLNRDQVRTAIAQPKGAKEITDEMYRTINRRNNAVLEAKQWVKEQGNSKVGNLIRKSPSTLFKLKTFGHGTVGGITHAGMDMFRLSTWNHYIKLWGNQFKYAFGNTAKYEQAMEDLKNDPDFTFWKRNGLAIDPKEKYDDYQGNYTLDSKKTNPFKRLFDRLGVAGDRGFNALKIYRLDLAKTFYDRLSATEKADPNSAKEIAQLVNHSSGTSEFDLGKANKFVNTAFFAPRLEASRWQGLIADPAKAISTFSKMAVNSNTVTPAEKAAAKYVARNAGEKIATYTALLAANAGMLSLMDSKQKINFTDPTASDWLKFKTGNGKTLDISGGVESSMKLLGSLLVNSYNGIYGSKKDNRVKVGDKDENALATQLRYKMSPIASTITDLVTTTDAMGRPLPYSNIKPKKGEDKYTWGQYVLQQQTPIPISAGVREAIGSMKQNGMSNPQIEDILKGSLYFAVEGFTGAKLGDEPKPKK